MFLAVTQRQAPARNAATERPVTVSAMEVKQVPFTPSATGYGSVTPAKTWFAVPQVGGRVVELHPEFVQGGTVRKGELLIRLAAEDYELAVRRAQAAIASAEASLAELAVQSSNTEQSLALEREQLALAERDLERQRNLVAKGSSSRASLDAQERTVLSQRARILDLTNQLRLVPQQRRSLEQNKAVADADLATAELNLERTQIRAPFDGRVASAEVELSQFVAAGSTAGVIDGMAVAEVNAQFAGLAMRSFARVAFEDLAGHDGGFDFMRLRDAAGMQAVVSIDFAGGSTSWDAEILRVSDTIDPQTRSVGLIVAVNDPYGTANPGTRPPMIKGMFVKVELSGESIPDAIAVPRFAVSDDAVWLVDADSRLERREVGVKAVIGDVAVISEGIAPGDRLIANAPEPAIEGMLLRPVLQNRLV